MRTSWKYLGGLATTGALLSGGALLTGCGSSAKASSAPGVVNASEQEWKITADHSSVKAGEVTFNVTNKGSINHELLVIRTDLPLGALAPGADGKFNEADPASTNVGESGEYAVGLTKTFKATLAPGKYQLVCNIPNHYKNGMHIAFTVTA